MRILVRTLISEYPSQVFDGIDAVHQLMGHDVIRWVGTSGPEDQERADLTVTCEEGWRAKKVGVDLFLVKGSITTSEQFDAL